MVLAGQGRSGQQSRVLFLDRDGVLNVDPGYVHRPEQLQWVPGSKGALQTLSRMGWALVVVSNQAGIARGYYSEDAFRRFMASMAEDLYPLGVRFARIAYCPHHPTAGQGPYRTGCSCRKPGPGMILQAASALQADLAHCVLVGDRISDIQAGRRAGVGRCLGVLSGEGWAAADRPAPDALLPDLHAVVAWLQTQPPPCPAGPQAVTN